MAVAFVLKGYPRLSETFIAQEMLGLERLGLDIRIVSLRHPTDKATHPVNAEIKAPVSYLPEYLYQEPGRVFAAWRKVRRMPGYARAWAAFRRDYARDRTANRVRRFGQACVLAAELPADVTRLHFHFLHTPASVVRYAAMMTGLDWSGSAHAKDIWTSEEWDLREKLAEMDWLATCTAYGAQHLRGLTDNPEKVDLTYHGLDFGRFADFDKAYSRADGDPSNEPVTLLSVGRAVAKKGYDDLLGALGSLPAGLNWRLIHIGGGTLSAQLKERAAELGLADRIQWLGAQSQEVVLENLRAADMFVLASKISGDGDRDGLPNVLMEAASQKLPILSTPVSAIPEFIQTNVHGILSDDEPKALADAISTLAADPQKAAIMADAAYDRLLANFRMDPGIARLSRRLKALCAEGA